MPPKVLMLVAVSCHMLTAVAATNWTNRPANSSLPASSSTPEDGRGHVVHQLDAQVGRRVVPPVEERLAHGQLTGARRQDRRSSSGRGSGIWSGRRDQDVDLAVRTEVELVEVGLHGRAGPAAHRPLARPGSRR